MSAEDVEGIRRCMMSLVADARALKRIEARFDACTLEMQRALRLEQVEIAARIDRSTRELFHLLPETMRPVVDSVLISPQGPRTGSSASQKKYDPKPGGPIPRSIRFPDWTMEQILALADAYKTRHGTWPTGTSGRIGDTSPDTWCGIDIALQRGHRGLPGGASLAKLLAEHRARRSKADLPPFNIEQILAWADDHHSRTGAWPFVRSGAVAAAPDETWLAVDHALRRGTRGIEVKTSLPRLLLERRGVFFATGQEPLTVEQILAWADAYHARTGRWPTSNSGDILEAPHESWRRIDDALHNGNRSLSVKSSLAKILDDHRGARNRSNVPDLGIEQILQWADSHYERHGKWPNCRSGPIEGAADETWAAVDAAIRSGSRGLRGSGFLSLSHLLDESRGALRSKPSAP